MTETLPWGTSIAWYLFLAGLAAGAYATSALASFKDFRNTKRLQLIGRIVALVVLAVGLVLLMFDASAGMKNPGRFFYLVSNPTSVMSWGVVILAIFGVIIIVTLIIMLLKKAVPVWLDAIGLLLAFCTAGYTGVLIGVVKTYPFWNTALLPVLFVVSAFSAGMAAVFLGSAFFARKEVEGLGVLKRLRLFLPIAETLLIIMLLLVTASANPAAAESVHRLIAGDLALPFWLGLVVIGLAFPFLLELVTIRVKAGSTGAAAIDVAGGAGVLVGGFLLRYLIIFAAVPLVFVL